MAYKTFANGFPLPASDLNNYLMNQSVIVFASSAERSSTLTSPTEGMVTYLEDTDTVEVYNGSAWTDINDNTAAIPKSTVTAQGDLIVADGASSVTNLGVGANGSLLYSDGTDPSWLANSGTEGDVLQVNATGGLEFATPSGGAVTTDWTVLVSGSALPTGAASATVTFTPGYDKYAIFINSLSSTSGDDFFISYKDSTGTTATTSPVAIYSVHYSTGNAETEDGGGANHRLGLTVSGSHRVNSGIYITGASQPGLMTIDFTSGSNQTSGSSYWGKNVNQIASGQDFGGVTITLTSGTVDGGFIWVYGA